MSNLTVTLNIGGTITKKSAKDSSIASSLVTDFLQEILGKAAQNININLGKFARNLPKMVENSYTDAVVFAAKRMVGTPVNLGAINRQVDKNDKLPKQAIKDPEGDTLTHWQMLSVRSIREQNEINGSRTGGHFYSRTGSLRLDLLGMARTYVKNTGVVKVTFNGKLRDARGRFMKASLVDKEVTLGDFSIKLMPNIRSGMLPGLATGNTKLHDPDLSFEKKLGFSEEALKKLRGASNSGFIIPGTHRPLLQPAFTYWTLNRIPQVIARSIAGSMPRAKAIDGSSGQVFTGV